MQEEMAYLIKYVQQTNKHIIQQWIKQKPEL